ncbi:MAG TPA: hypothetical protein VHH36_01715 [Candidatus Thermoplasmatota archaeon]|nr:hypothetical protein [Candidatus Thermoplasmatota archaeon]
MRAAPLAVVLAVLAAGCALPDAPPDAATNAGPGAADAPPARLTADGRVEVEVPVPVVLIGFDPGVADALAQRLRPERIASAWQPVPPPGPSAPEVLERQPVPLVALARYDVREAPAALAAALRANLSAWQVPGEPSILDAKAADAWLEGALRDAGLLPDACCPGLVLLHVGTEGRHGWRASFENGYIQPARYFGERAPYGVLDASAKKDPNGNPAVVSEARPYTDPLPAGGAATVDALERAARDAARYRLLHNPIFPVSTAPCHAITLILATRAAALTEALPGHPRAADLTFVDLLRGHFENVTGNAAVHVDFRALSLPTDDPALDALTRGPVVGAYTTWAWVAQHFDDYWIPHDGCEPYVSVMVQGDAADQQSVGAAVYPGSWSRRVSTSVIGETSRIFWNATLAEGQGEARQHQERPGWFTYFWAHETGHLMGLQHTQDHDDEKGAAPSLLAFSTGQSPMGYTVQGPTSDFGSVDRATFARHRAGWAIHEAWARGMEGTPEMDEALRLAGMREWEGAWRALLPTAIPSGG